MSTENKYQIHPELVGTMGLNALLRESSAPRLYMFFGQLSQAVTVKGANRNMLTTFAEDEFGKYTFSKRMKNKGEIYRVVRKFPPTDLDARGAKSPSTIAVYQNLDSDDREFDVLELETYVSMHQHFGFSYVPRPAMSRLQPKGVIRKNEELLGCPVVKDDGSFCYGTETNLALMTIADVIEDGAKCSIEWLETQKTECFGRRVFRLNKGEMPLNTYGDLDVTRIMPEIGERIGSDGLIFAARKIDPLIACLQLLPRNMLRDRIVSTDKTVYAVPGAEVIDIRILRGRGSTNEIPSQMEEQLVKYLEKQTDFYRQINDIEIDLYRNFGPRIKFSPALSRLFVDARANLDMVSRSRVADPVFNKVPVNDWMVVIEYRYWLTPTIGMKIADSQGAKSILVSKAPRSEMPTDMHGNVADVVMDPNSTVKRSNLGRTTEQYLKASMSYHSTVLRGLMDSQSGRAGIDAAWEMYKDYVSIISPVHRKLLDDPELDYTLEMKQVYREGIRIYAPTDNPVDYYLVIDELERKYKLPIGPVTFIGKSGRHRKTKQDVLIGPVYMYLLEKDARDWSAVASSRLHPSYGTPTKLGAADKHRGPGKESAIKALGETEERLVYNACGGYALQQIIERSNNPLAHRFAVRSVMTAKHPTNIENTVDWNQVPTTGGKPMQYVSHLYQCMGIKWEIPAENTHVDYFPPGY